jgi:diaminohydroxyphosphoribosylaminopyrimidine deaminase/5-amino-6-(5-phosphoribosylamino)uracil reductase
MKMNYRERLAKKAGTCTEVNAINSVKDKSLLKKATIVSRTLQSFWKKPPCSDLIINKSLSSYWNGRSM